MNSFEIGKTYLDSFGRKCRVLGKLAGLQTHPLVVFRGPWPDETNGSETVEQYTPSGMYAATYSKASLIPGAIEDAGPNSEAEARAEYKAEETAAWAALDAARESDWNVRVAASREAQEKLDAALKRLAP